MPKSRAPAPARPGRSAPKRRRADLSAPAGAPVPRELPLAGARPSTALTLPHVQARTRTLPCDPDRRRCRSAVPQFSRSQCTAMLSRMRSLKTFYPDRTHFTSKRRSKESVLIRTRYHVASRTWRGFRLMHRIDGEGRVRVGGAGAHFGGDPNRFHDLLFGHALFQCELGVATDAIRTLGHMRY